jgi:hypothetical protein
MPRASPRKGHRSSANVADSRAIHKPSLRYMTGETHIMHKPIEKPWARPVALLLLAAALLLSACAGAEKVRYHRFTGDEFSARDQRAEILPGPPRDLSDEGYVLLGHVEVLQPLRECEGTNCFEFTHELPARDRAREVATTRGGDVILLAKDGEIERVVREKEGRCRMYAPGPTLVRPGSMMTLQRDCLVYEPVPFVREVSVTEGYVWRHEPSRVSERSREIWKRWFRQGPGAALGDGSGRAPGKQDAEADP